jgi:hypothetical protein
MQQQHKLLKPFENQAAFFYFWTLKASPNPSQGGEPTEKH